MKRGHVPQLSISDDNHHVTEAIGDMYGDHHDGKRDPRPLSFQPSLLNDTIEQARPAPQFGSTRSFSARSPLTRTTSNERSPPQIRSPTQTTMASRSPSFGREHGPLSPTLPHRTPSDTATSSFPLNDLDYESNPAAITQELNNLQALRRMSMDVNAAGDPDLPAFNSNFGMPSLAPTGDEDEDDASRLFWVPARLHPELAPKEFKTFLDSRVNSIKRRSGESSLSPDGPLREGSSGGLRRKKSMLSRQIDNAGGKGAEGYTDGAERLDRQRSLSGQEALNSGISNNLQELEVLVNDPERVMQRLSLDTDMTGGEVPASEDMPILPAVPASNSLRRSTRTTYRRGSLRKGERVPFSKRAGARAADEDRAESPISSPMTGSDETFPSLPLTRVSTEPKPERPPPENFSRPVRRNINRAASPNSISPPNSYEETLNSQLPADHRDSRDRSSTSPEPNTLPKHFVSSIASNGRSSINPQILGAPVPSIVETPPPDSRTPPSAQNARIPERRSSHEPPPHAASQASAPNTPPLAAPLRGGKRPIVARPSQPNPNDKSPKSLNDLSNHPSPLPGNSTRTDSLSFIPTLTEDRKADGKKAGLKKDAAEGPRKSSWSWSNLIGSEEKEKEKRKEEEAKEAKKGRSKLRPGDKLDATRLDVLQTTMDGGRGRESLVLDRGDLKLEEERKKESNRKASGGDKKKEKEPGLIASFFGGKKKNEHDSTGKKFSPRGLSPDPPHRILKPDVDYNWTRFSILEERAIYRMAHIKLANPRRALYSQVLLSNFMYSYLAKVQQMHPQIQIPQTAAQKAQQRQQQQQRKAEQPEEYHQYQKYQEVSLNGFLDQIGS